MKRIFNTTVIARTANTIIAGLLSISTAQARDQGVYVYDDGRARSTPSAVVLATSP